MRVTNTWARYSLAALLTAGAMAATIQHAHAQTSAASATSSGTDTWLTYKADAQRTNSRSVRLELPLNLLWRHSTASPPGEFITSPLVTGAPTARRIFFSTGDAMYCIDANAGEQIWQSTMTGGRIVSPLTMIRNGNEDLILGVTEQNTIIAVRAATGTQAWEYAAKAQVQAGLPAVITTPRGERIVAAIGDSRLIALTPAGQVDTEWAVRLGRRIADPSSTPALSIDGRRLFITARDRNVYALDAATGTTAYTIEMESSTDVAPVVVQDELILVTRNILSGHNVQDGKRIWNVDLRDTLLAPPSASTTNGRKIVYVGSRNGTLSAIEAPSGKVLWSINVEASISTSPTVLSDLLLVGTGTGMLIGVKPDDGAILWQYRLHSSRTTQSPPALGGGAEAGTGAVTGTVTGDDNEAAAMPFVTSVAQFGPGIGTPAPGTPAPGIPAPGFPTPGFPAPVAPAPDTLSPPLVTQIYGISATPVAVGDKLFVLGDNAALYAFDARPLDVLPPRAVAPSLSVPDIQGRLVPSLLEGSRPQAVPGQAPIYFAVELSDTGSGVNASTIKVTLNNQPVAPQNVYFQRASGVLTVTLAEKLPLNKGNLPDGQFSVTIIARDYRNNEMTYSTSFMVDNSLAPPSSTPPPVAAPPVAPGGFGLPGVGGGIGGM